MGAKSVLALFILDFAVHAFGCRADELVDVAASVATLLMNKFGRQNYLDSAVHRQLRKVCLQKAITFVGSGIPIGR